jgi:hypothetical protein
MPTSRRRPPLPRRTSNAEQRAAPVIEIAFGERQRFLDTEPGAPKDHDQATQASPMRVVPGLAHHGDDVDLRWIGGGSGDPCSAAVARCGSRASSRAIGGDQRDRAETSSDMVPPRARRSRPSIRRSQPLRHSRSSEHGPERRAPTAAARPKQRSAHRVAAWLRPDGPTPLASTYTRSTTAPPPPPATARLSASAAAVRP